MSDARRMPAADYGAPVDARWQALFGCAVPPRLDDLVANAVAWHEQRLVHGDVSPAIARDLAVAARSALEQRRDTRQTEVGQGRGPTSVASQSVPASPRVSTTTAPLPPASSQIAVGARLVKSYNGDTHVVEVTADGMLYCGTLFPSLSAVAKHITGTHWNGLLFFGLRRRKTYPAKAATSG